MFKPESLTSNQRTIRAMIRGFLMTATRDELERELQISLEHDDEFRAACVRELINEP